MKSTEVSVTRTRLTAAQRRALSLYVRGSDPDASYIPRHDVLARLARLGLLSPANAWAPTPAGCAALEEKS
jgi:hypothetical protein